MRFTRRYFPKGSGALYISLPAFLDFRSGIVMEEQRQQLPLILLSRNPTG
jgi:hypothetical protein